MKKALRVLLPVLFAVIAFGASAPLASASVANWYVDPSGTDDATAFGTTTSSGAFRTIQYAINNATGSDIITIAAGTYAENISLSGKANLTLLGAGQDATVIEPATGTRSVGITITNSNGITIRNLKIHTSGPESHGIWVYGAALSGGAMTGLTVQDTTINVDGLASGIIGDSSAGGVHSGWLIGGVGHGNTILINNVANDGGDGIDFQDVSASEVSYNTITIPHSEGSTNVLWTSERFNLTNLVFNNNIVSGSGGSEVSVLTDFNHPPYAGGVPLEAGPVVTTISGVTFQGNTFSNWGSRAIRVGQGQTTGATDGISGITISSNTFQMTADTTQVIGGTATDKTGTGNIFNVSSPAQIQKAIDAAFAGDTINVAAGTYNLTSRIDVNKAVSIVGDVTTPSNVVINAPVAGGTQHGQNSVFMVTSSNVTIQGFRIQGALHTGAAQNAGIYVDDPRTLANPGLSGITISNNEVTDNGYGIILMNAKNSTVSNNKVFSNKKAAGANMYKQSGIGIVIYGNAVDTNHTNNLTISGNDVYDNDTEGIRVGVGDQVGPDYLALDMGITISGNHVYNNGSLIADTGYDTYIGIKSSGWSNGVTVTGNEIYNHTGTTISATSGNAGIQINASKGWSISNNNIHDNLNGIFFANSGAYGATTGSHTISSNNITVNVRGISIDKGSEAVATGNSITGNSSTAFSAIPFLPYDVLNRGVVVFDATNNYWGSVSPNFGAILSGDVTHDPWYLDGNKTILSSTIDAIFDGVASTLLGQGVVSNIGDVTASNFTSFPSLSFEKRTDVSSSTTAIGKITFNVALDLSDTATQTFLQNLGSKMEQAAGRIALDVQTAAEFANKGATLVMYGLPAGLTSQKVVARNDADTILDASTIVSGFTQNPTTGDVTFTATHFTQFDIDTTAPTGTIVINGGATYTNSQDVTLTLSAVDNLSGVTQMEVYKNTSPQGIEPYSTTRLLTLTSGDATKTVKVKFFDAAGNESSLFTTTIILDTLAPAVPVISTLAQSVNTDTIHITGSAEVGATITITGGASTATGTATGGNYDVVVTLTHNAVNHLSVTAKDIVNNVSTVATVDITHDDTSLAPTSFAVGSPTLTTLALSWTNTEANGSYYTIKRSSSPITDDATFAAATTLGGAPTVVTGAQGYVAKNLANDTGYYFAIRMIDAVGNVSAISTASGTTTAPGAPASSDVTPPSAVSDLGTSAGAIATSQIVLSWSATGDDGSTGIATKYIIKRSTSAIDAGNFDAATTVFNSISPSASSSPETLTVSGLLTGTQYCFALKVLDEVPNTGAISNSVCRTTSADVPTVTSVSPVTGQNDGSVSITVTGTHFVSGATTVRFTNSSNTFDLVGSYASGTSVTASVPVGVPSGVYGVRVIDSAGTSNVLASAYTVTDAPTPLPSVTDVVPSNIGTNDADVAIEIYGTSFTGATGAVLDTGAPTTLTNFVVVSATKITATIPGTLAAGTYNVKVTSPSGTNTVSAVQITVTAPVVINSGTTQDQVTDKPIDMGNTNTTPVQITMNSNTDDSTLDSNTTIEVIIPPATELTNADGTDYTGNINPPQLVKPTEEIAAKAGDDAVVITMGNPDQTINFSQNFVTTVTLETTKTTAPIIWYYNPSSGLEIAGIDGTKDGVTYAKGGTVLNTVVNGSMYTYTIGLLLNHMSSYVAGVTPTITSLSPAQAVVGSTVVINGTNFSPGATVQFGSTSVNVSANSTTQLTVVVPSLASGSHVVTVTNTDALSVSSSFTIVPASSGGGGGGSFSSSVAVTPSVPAVPTVPAVPATPTTPAQAQGQVLGASVYHFTKNLALGARGSEVTALQESLIAGGYSVPSGATGYFGRETRAAVIAFQKARGIAQVGNVGPLTRTALNEGVAPTAPVARAETNLSASQADAIISLIESFGADASIVAKVRASLGR